MLNDAIRTIRKRFSKKESREIAPDEIFLDTHNFPQFDTSQFEGRIEKPIKKQTLLLLYAFIVLCGFVFLGRIGELQIQKGALYTSISENNRLEHSVLFADRGVIYDRNGILLAWNKNNDSLDFSERVYADSPGMAHLIGYIQYPLKDTTGKYYQETYIGKVGIEEAFNSSIAGENGLKIVETNALGERTSESVFRRSKNGTNITLSIDARVEGELYRQLERAAGNAPFQGGAGVLMDVWTGELLALVSFPEYRSGALLEGNAEVIQTYQEDPRKPFLNRTVSGLYSPGSIVKPFIALGALEENTILPEKKIESTGALSVPNPYVPDKPSIFRDWKAHGWVDMEDALAVSSDIYFYTIGGGYGSQKGLGIANIEKYMRLFGFGEKTGISLSSEAIGTIPSPAWKKETFEDGVWRIGNTYHTAIGQYGVEVTPIQAARATAAIANNGTLLSPSLIHSEAREGKHLAIQQEHFSIVQEGMRAAVTRGTAQGLSVSQVAIAAKTGTAEIGTEKKYVNSWVIGFFPYEEPRFAFAVVLERGPVTNLVGALSVMRGLIDWMSLHTREYLE